ncbi:hypothetical protein CSKR_104830, partial [Clonorchis sinensis]
LNGISYEKYTQFGFCERLTWNPAESPVCDVFRQLNVLHQAASCSSCYDIRDIVIHAQSPSFRQPYVLLEPKLDCAYLMSPKKGETGRGLSKNFQQPYGLTKTREPRLPDEPQEGRNRSWAVEEFSATL